MGYGISDLFKTAIQTARKDTCPLPQAPSAHIARELEPLSQALKNPQIEAAFRVPHQLLLTLFACGHGYFERELSEHFAPVMPTLLALRQAAGHNLSRALADEIHDDGHHRAATIFEAALRPESLQTSHGWHHWLDELLLHPQWGLLGSVAMFASVLFVVFKVSGWIDAQTTHRLIEAASNWQPQGTLAVVAHAVMDGFIGLISIVVPYMLPLLLMIFQALGTQNIDAVLGKVGWSR